MPQLEYTREIQPITHSQDTRHYVNKDVVIVDKREFKSSLPAKLFFSGFKVVPLFLEIGDYVLTPNTAIERKCVSTGDLLSSVKLEGYIYFFVT
jgi:ERCC4-type nuclease